MERELAVRTGLDFSYISKVENSRLPPPAADTIVSICNVLGVSPEELLALTGKTPNVVYSERQALREVGRLSNHSQLIASSAAPVPVYMYEILLYPSRLCAGACLCLAITWRLR